MTDIFAQSGHPEFPVAETSRKEQATDQEGNRAVLFRQGDNRGVGPASASETHPLLVQQITAKIGEVFQVLIQERP